MDEWTEKNEPYIQRLDAPYVRFGPAGVCLLRNNEKHMLSRL